MTQVVGTVATEKFSSQLTAFGINPSKAHRNLDVNEMVNLAVERKEGVVNSTGSLSVNTGKYTGRSPQDKYIVEENSSKENIWWGSVNQKISEDIFNELYQEVISYYNSSKSKTYLFDLP